MEAVPKAAEACAAKAKVAVAEAKAAEAKAAKANAAKATAVEARAKVVEAKATAVEPAPEGDSRPRKRSRHLVRKVFRVDMPQYFAATVSELSMLRN